MKPTFEIVEGKAWHCGAMSRLLRAEHRSAVDALDLNPHHELRACFDASAFRRAWLIDGAIAALGGVTGMMLNQTGGIWLAVASRAQQFPIAMLKEAKRQLEEILLFKSRVSTQIMRTDPASFRFARSLGFYVVHPLPFDFDEHLVQMEACGSVKQRLAKRRSDAPFIVYTAGRSRTAWLSSFLTYGDYRCHNEVAIKFRRMSEVQRFFADDKTGSAETAAAPGWRLINHCAPSIRTVVVQRDEKDIVASFARMEIAKIAAVNEERLRKVVAYENRCLEAISAQPGTLTVRFEDLDKPSVCKAVFEHCLPYEFDFDWWEEMSRRNVQSDVLSLVRYYQDNIEDVENFKRDSKRHLIHLARSGDLAGGQHALH